MKNEKIQLKGVHKLLIKITISSFQSFLLLFIGLLISFAFFHFAFMIPQLNKLSMLLTPEEYNLILTQFGYNDPIPIKFLKYLTNFFSGNWGISYLISDDLPVTEVLRAAIFDTFEIMGLPLLIGLGGFKLGSVLKRKRKKFVDKTLTLFIAIGIAIPLFFLGSMLQYLFSKYTELPASGRYSISFYSSLPDITGLLLFDSVISGNWPLVFDIILHSILPWLILSIVITSLLLKQERTRIENDPFKNSIVSNSFIAGKLFGYLFVFTVIIELMLNLRGFGWYFIASIFQGDLLLINGCILVIVIFFSFTLLLANLVPITMGFIRKRLTKGVQSEVGELNDNYREEARKKINFKLELKSYVISSLKNPYTIIGGCLILILFIASGIYPLLGFYTLEEVILLSFPINPPYSPPSPTHPLGTTAYGFDVLARTLYGTQGTFIFGFIVALVGLGGGSLFGSLAGKFHRYVYNSVIGPMIIFFLFPSFLILILVAILPVINYKAITVLIGILTIPIFARVIANAIRREKNYFEITKSIIKSIPLEIVFAILLYQTLGFIGLSDSQVPQLGETLNWGRGHISAIWATLWPGLFLFIITLSLIFLHEGLEAPASYNRILDSRSSRNHAESEIIIKKSQKDGS